MNSVSNSSGDTDAENFNEAPRSRIASAAAMQIGARVLGTGASLITVAVTTRALGPEAYGHLQTALMFVTLWASLTEMGIGSVIVRRVTGLTECSAADAHTQLQRFVRTNLGLSSVVSVPLTVVAFASGALIYRDNPQVVTMIGMVSAMLLLNAIASSYDPLFMVSVRFKAVALADVLGRLLSMVATIVLAALGVHVYWFAVVIVIPYAAALIVKAIAARRIGVTMPVYEWRASWDLVRESLPQTVIIVVAVLYWRIDGVILSTVSTAEQVGLYGLAYTLAFTASMVSDLFLNTTLSTSTELFASSRRRFVEFSRRNMELIYFLALPLIVIGGILATGLMTLVGSAAFSHGGTVLAVLFAAAGLTFVNAAASQALFAAHQQVFLMRVNLVNLCVNIVLNVLLAHHFGAIGAAGALLTTELLGVLLTTAQLARLGLHIQPMTFVLWCVPPLALGSALAWVIGDVSAVVAGIVAGAAYLGAAMYAGPLRSAYLKSFLGRGEGDEVVSTGESSAVGGSASGVSETAGGSGRGVSATSATVRLREQRPIPRFVPFSEAETTEMPIIRTVESNWMNIDWAQEESAFAGAGGRMS